ncbi:MAG: hypothetical protein ACHWZW_03075 [Spirulina sp.]
MLLKKNLVDDAAYWITLKQPVEIAGKTRYPSRGKLRLTGAAVKAIYASCATITPALLED